jgi:hypothetical protein
MFAAQTKRDPGPSRGRRAFSHVLTLLGAFNRKGDPLPTTDAHGDKRAFAAYPLKFIQGL